MIHRQQRRDLSVDDSGSATMSEVAAHCQDTHPVEPVATVEPVRPTDPRSDVEAPALPRQSRRPRRDAYDLYAQIYAIRTEDHPA